MSKKVCYFKCKHDGQVYHFPPVTYKSYEKYCKWKDILRKEDKGKDDHYITHNIKLCSNHFEKYYIAANKRLTKHAVPTLIHGITLQQEEFLRSFIEENSNIIMEYDFNSEILESLQSKCKTIAPHLNALGSQKTYNEWAEFLFDIMSNLKTKEVKWSKDTSTPEIKNTDDFTELELKILQLWHTASPDNFETNYEEEDDFKMEYMIEVGECDNSGDSWPIIGDNETNNEIFTFTLNIDSGGQKPLLQAADIAPYEAPQDTNVKCKCTQFNIEIQDEFDAFGKDIAKQLRNMPTQTALETQKMLLSVLRSKQTKILNDSFLQY